MLVGLVLGSPVAEAQQALGAAARIRTSPETLLILRPEAGLRVLATDVAAVLELRTGERVEVGEAPPPGLLEAVPAGHVAMARRDGAVLLVLGASGGRSLDATVRLGAEEPAADARAVALAAEDLRDTAAELARRGGPPAEATPAAPTVTPTADAPLPSPYYQQHPRAQAAWKPAPGPSSQDAIDDGDEISGTSSTEESPTDVDFLFFGRLYGGASTASSAPATGIGTGVGLCVERHCLVVGAEMPLSFGDQRLDVRYRYPTFTSGFYTRPFTFGAFTAGATFGFLTRLGHFRADMGLSDEGLDTDLGARGSLELALEAYTNFDLITEWGVDFTIDRHRLAAGDRVVDRGDQWSPWGQFALRARL
jgi:hypothetical protein